MRALAAIGFRHRGIDHLDHRRRHVYADAIAFDERNDRLVRHLIEPSVLIRIFVPAAGTTMCS